MNKALLGVDQYGYIDIDQYIHFYNIIPKRLWSEKPIFYYRKGKYDALGFLLESPHKFTMQSKTLSLYFQEILNITITSIWDDPLIVDKRSCFLSYLKKIKKENKKAKLIRVYNKAKEIYNDRYY